MRSPSYDQFSACSFSISASAARILEGTITFLSCAARKSASVLPCFGFDIELPRCVHGLAQQAGKVIDENLVIAQLAVHRVQHSVSKLVVEVLQHVRALLPHDEDHAVCVAPVRLGILDV